ncbi:MAG: hypothetical protein JXR87_04265 [Candidatus Marinimicrobia bacterium]|nr:hypothetical protein [Candidatus Neomarinimicrobiota bacterium]
MTQLFNVVKQTALFSILLIAISCTPEISVSVIVPESRFVSQKNPIQIYLLSSEEYTAIENVKIRNGAYFRKKLLSISDSLKVLKSAYNSISRELTSTSENCSTLMQQLPIEYCSKVIASPVKIAKYGDVWQLAANLNNNGNEDIWGLVMSVKYKDNIIINHKEYSVFLQPNQNHIFNINFDLSNNIPLQYSIATYPGGLNQMLQEAMTIEVDSVISMFSASTAECKQRLVSLERDLETIGIAFDVYSERASEYLDEAIIKPVNRILEENLRQIEHKSNITDMDTVIFGSLKRGGYKLLIFSDIEADSTQYVIPVDLTQVNSATINVERCSPSQFFLNKDRFLARIPYLLGQ